MGLGEIDSYLWLNETVTQLKAEAFLGVSQKARKNILKAIGLSFEIIPKVRDSTREEALGDEWRP